MKRLATTCLTICAIVIVSGASFANSVEYLQAVSDAQAEIYERVAPSVVRIGTSRQMSRTNPHMGNPFRDLLPFGGSPFEGDPHHNWEDLLRRHVDPHHPSKPRKEEKSDSEKDDEEADPIYRGTGIGSGLIVKADADGAWILTNNHVIEDAERAAIWFKDDSPIEEFDLVTEDEEDAEQTVFLDWKTDLALIRIPAEVVGNRKLVPATFGDSDSLRTGDLVFTLGSPLNREWSFGQGIVSGKGRGNVLPGPRESVRYEGLIQTTAFINVGNSGGPMLDVQGNVVGINVAIQTAGGMSNGFIGIGFSIPSNRAKHVMESLIDKGRVDRGWLGVSIRLPSREEVEPYGLRPYRGVHVETVGRLSPAERGGLTGKDVILSFNGVEVEDPAHLQDLVAIAPIEENAEVEVLRDGERVTLQVPIGLQPDKPERPKKLDPDKPHFAELGATLRNPTEEEAAYFKERGGFEGVLVDRVDEESPLVEGDAKIGKGSLITEIDYQPVRTVDEVRAKLDDIRKKAEGKDEKRAMLKFVSSSSMEVEEFQVIKLRVK